MSVRFSEVRAVLILALTAVVVGCGGATHATSPSHRAPHTTLDLVRYVEGYVIGNPCPVDANCSGGRSRAVIESAHCVRSPERRVYFACLAELLPWPGAADSQIGVIVKSRGSANVPAMSGAIAPRFVSGCTSGTWPVPCSYYYFDNGK